MISVTSSIDRKIPGISIRFRFLLVCVFLASLAVYLPSLRGAAFWDDTDLMRATPGTATSSLLLAFTKPFANYYRPLTSASFAIENALFRGNPFYYHLDNVILHALTAVAVAVIAFVLVKSHWAGLLAGLFFAYQPTQVGATSWIGGRTDTLSTLFLSLFLISILQTNSSKSAWWKVAGGLTYFLAILSKEQAILSVACVPLSVLLFGTRQKRDAWRLTWPYLLILVVYVLM